MFRFIQNSRWLGLVLIRRHTVTLLLLIWSALMTEWIAFYENDVCLGRQKQHNTIQTYNLFFFFIHPKMYKIIGRMNREWIQIIRTYTQHKRIGYAWYRISTCFPPFTFLVKPTILLEATITTKRQQQQRHNIVTLHPHTGLSCALQVASLSAAVFYLRKKQNNENTVKHRTQKGKSKTTANCLWNIFQCSFLMLLCGTES